MKKQLQQALQQRPPRAYALALAREPLAWGCALFVMLASAATSALLAAPGMLALTAATCIAARRPAVRRYVDARRLRERARQRREEREARLEEANADPEGLERLTVLLEHVVRYDPGRAEALELEALLDRYTEATIALAGCRHLLSSTDLGRLERLRASLDPGSPRAALVARRLALWTECQERRRVLEEELATIHELFVLAAQQALSGSSALPEDGAAIDERLAYLEALDEL